MGVQKTMEMFASTLFLSTLFLDMKRLYFNGLTAFHGKMTLFWRFRLGKVSFLWHNFLGKRTGKRTIEDARDERIAENVE